MYLYFTNISLQVQSSPAPPTPKKNHYSFYFIATDGNGLREIVGKAKCTPRDSPTPQNKIKNPS